VAKDIAFVLNEAAQKLDEQGRQCGRGRQLLRQSTRVLVARLTKAGKVGEGQRR